MRHLLKQNRPFRQLFFALVTSTFGSWFYTVALLGLVYLTTGSTMKVSLILLADALPRLILAPIAGAVADRFDKKKVMVVSDLARGGVTVCAIPFIHDLPIVFILTVIKSISGAFFVPARQAVIPHILKDEQLAKANALTGFATAGVGVIGASLGGVIASFLSPQIAFLTDAVTFFVSGWIVLKTRIPLPDHANMSRNEPFLRSISNGFRYVLQSHIVLSLIIVGISWGIIGGAFSVLVVIYGAAVFHAGTFGIGMLQGAQGVGVLVGSGLVIALFSQNRRRMITVFGWAYFLQGGFFILFVLSGNLYVGLLFLLAMRTAGGIIISLDTTLLQRHTPPSMLGRVISLHTATYSTVMQISVFLSGLFLERFSPKSVGLTLGIGCLMVSIYWLVNDRLNKLESPMNHPHETTM